MDEIRTGQTANEEFKQLCEDIAASELPTFDEDLRERAEYYVTGEHKAPLSLRQRLLREFNQLNGDEE